MKRWFFFALLAAACVAAGCGNSHRVSTTPPWPVENVDHIDVWAVNSAAINWDEVPGPDGVRLSVFLFQGGQAEPVMTKGTLEFSMYEGRPKAAASQEPKLLRTWTFTTQELATRQMRSMVGWGYAIQLGWGRDVPQTPAVTVVAKYIPPKGEPLVSSPTVIEVPK